MYCKFYRRRIDIILCQTARDSRYHQREKFFLPINLIRSQRTQSSRYSQRIEFSFPINFFTRRGFSKIKEAGTKWIIKGLVNQEWHDKSSKYLLIKLIFVRITPRENTSSLLFFQRNFLARSSNLRGENIGNLVETTQLPQNEFFFASRTVWFIEPGGNDLCYLANLRSFVPVAFVWPSWTWELKICSVIRENRSRHSTFILVPVVRSSIFISRSGYFSGHSEGFDEYLS